MYFSKYLRIQNNKIILNANKRPISWIIYFASDMNYVSNQTKQKRPHESSRGRFIRISNNEIT